MLIDYEKTRGSGFVVSDCLNLRPDARGDNAVLVPVGEPVAVAPTGFQPLVADGNCLFITKGSELYTVLTDAECDPEYLCTLPSTARCALVTTRTVWVMTAEGPWRIIRKAEGDYTVAGLMPRWPAITLQGVEGELFEAEICAEKIGGIADAMRSAYAELDRQARAAGQLLQPVVARVRIYDGEGTLLHTGPQVLVSGPSGAQLCGNLRFETTGDGDERVTAARMMQARGWILQARVDDTVDPVWAQIAARADIEVAPQFHPYDPDAKPVITAVRGSSKGEIVVTMPGAERGLDDSNRVGARRRLMAVVEHFDDMATCVHKVVNPYVNIWQRELAIAQSGVISQADAIESALAKRAVVVESDKAQMAVPHSFTAACVARGADTVVWGDATPVPFCGWDAAWFAEMCGDRAWQGSVAVDFADGSRVVHTLTGHANPLSLSAMICYPLPTAVNLTLSVLVDGEVNPYVVDVPLTPDATGRRAVWIADDLQPVVLEQVAVYAIPVGIGRRQSPRLLVATRADSALSVGSMMNMGEQLLAIACATATSTGVNTPPCRFYAVCRDAINLVSVGSGATSIATAFLTSADVHSRQCVAPSNNAVYVASDHRLLELKGLSVNVLSENISATAIVADEAAGEILVVNDDDNECVHLMLRNGMRRYHTSLVVNGLTSGHYAVTDAGIVDLCRRRIAVKTPVVWRATTLVAGGKPLAVKAMEWSIKGSSVKGTLALERTWLTSLVRHPATMGTMRVDGMVASPLSMPLNSHPAREVALTIHADVSADFAITYPSITV